MATKCGNCGCVPHLVAMETHLTCVIPCIEQEDFVSMVRDLTVIAFEISVYSNP
jgi:hypothetical protein